MRLGASAHGDTPRPVPRCDVARRRGDVFEGTADAPREPEPAGERDDEDDAAGKRQLPPQPGEVAARRRPVLQEQQPRRIARSAVEQERKR